MSTTALSIHRRSLSCWSVRCLRRPSSAAIPSVKSGTIVPLLSTKFSTAAVSMHFSVTPVALACSTRVLYTSTSSRTRCNSALARLVCDSGCLETSYGRLSTVPPGVVPGSDETIAVDTSQSALSKGRVASWASSVAGMNQDRV